MQPTLRAQPQPGRDFSASSYAATLPGHDGAARLTPTVGRPLPSSCPGLTRLCPASAVTFTTPHAIRRASHSPLCLWFARARLYQLRPVVPGWCVPAGAKRPLCPLAPGAEQCVPACTNLSSLCPAGTCPLGPTARRARLARARPYDLRAVPSAFLSTFPPNNACNRRCGRSLQPGRDFSAPARAVSLCAHNACQQRG